MTIHLRSDLPVYPGCESILTATAPPTFKALACDPPVDQERRARIQRTFALISIKVGWLDREGCDLQFEVRVMNVGDEPAVAEFDLLDRDDLIETEEGYIRRTRVTL